MLVEEGVHRRGRGPVAARSLERKRREVRPRCRAGGIVLAVLEILRARGAGEDVIARIVFVRARLVVEGSTVDELLFAVCLLAESNHPLLFDFCCSSCSCCCVCSPARAGHSRGPPPSVTAGVRRTGTATHPSAKMLTDVCSAVELRC